MIDLHLLFRETEGASCDIDSFLHHCYREVKQGPKSLFAMSQSVPIAP